MAGGGGQYVVVFSRQSGKDEMLAQVLAYLLTLHRLRGGSIVVAAPTLQPQGLITLARLADTLHNPLTSGVVAARHNVITVGRARCSFLSTAPGANPRGETASLLLVCNESQDVSPERWDAVFDPMAASTNATTVFMGTVWTARTLLARQMRYLQELEAQDGERRVFKAPWETVARDVPAYGEQRARQARAAWPQPPVREDGVLSRGTQRRRRPLPRRDARPDARRPRPTARPARRLCLRPAH